MIQLHYTINKIICQDFFVSMIQKINTCTYIIIESQYFILLYYLKGILAGPSKTSFSALYIDP